jgi:hypothetical protein
MMDDHRRTIESGAWIGAMVVAALLGMLDRHLPHLLAFAVNWLVVLAVCYGMALWKRAWYAWLAFWLMAAICPVSGILQLAGVMTTMSSDAVWMVACAVVFAWYWLVRIPRKQPEAVQDAQATHVIHHHVFHVPGAALPFEVPSGTVIPGELAGPAARSIAPPAGLMASARARVASVLSRR